MDGGSNNISAVNPMTIVESVARCRCRKRRGGVRGMTQQKSPTMS